MTVEWEAAEQRLERCDHGRTTEQHGGLSICTECSKTWRSRFGAGAPTVRIVPKAGRSRHLKGPAARGKHRRRRPLKAQPSQTLETRSEASLLPKGAGARPRTRVRSAADLRRGGPGRRLPSRARTCVRARKSDFGSPTAGLLGHERMFTQPSSERHSTSCARARVCARTRVRCDYPSGSRHARSIRGGGVARGLERGRIAPDARWGNGSPWRAAC